MRTISAEFVAAERQVAGVDVRPAQAQALVRDGDRPYRVCYGVEFERAASLWPVLCLAEGL